MFILKINIRNRIVTNYIWSWENQIREQSLTTFGLNPGVAGFCKTSYTSVIFFSQSWQAAGGEGWIGRLEKYAFANGGRGGGKMICSDQWAPWFCFWKVEDGWEWEHGVLAGLLKGWSHSPYLGFIKFYGNHNHPFVIWKSGASIPLKGFLFCRFLVMLLPETLCQLMFAYGRAPSNCFSHYTVLQAGRLPACGSLSPSQHLGLARGPFKGQGNANYFPSWHLHERYNICPLGEMLLKGNWEFGSRCNSYNHKVSGLKEKWKTETMWGGRMEVL